jgi:hypothetical protein
MTTTVTKESLAARIAELESGARSLKEDYTLAAYKMLLATMESEPVAWTDEQELRDVDRGGCGYLFTVNPVTPHADERQIILLYRQAQPAPVVPDKMTAIVKDEAEYVEGWNDCRATMLNQVGNSPVKIQGWIPVSERMPDENEEQQILACFKGGDISTLYYFEGRWDDAYGIVPIRQDVTHWMPLPAVPVK